MREVMDFFLLIHWGANIFSKGKDSLNLTLKKGEEVTFRYRILIADRLPDASILDKEAADFGKK